jgi:hypothetical protein
MTLNVLRCSCESSRSGAGVGGARRRPADKGHSPPSRPQSLEQLLLHLPLGAPEWGSV